MARSMKFLGCVAALAAFILLAGCATRAERTRALLTQYQKADLAYDRNDCVTAITLYRELAERMTEDTKSLLRIGNCHARSRSWAAAAAAYRQALQRDRDYLSAWYNLSYIQARVLQETVASMLRYVDPDDPASRRILDIADQVLKPYQLDVAAPVELQDEDGRARHHATQ